VKSVGVVCNRTSPVEVRLQTAPTFYHLVDQYKIQEKHPCSSVDGIPFCSGIICAIERKQGKRKMDPISLIAIVLIIGSASVFLDRKWRARQADGAKMLSLTEAKEQATSFLSQTSSQAQAMTGQAAERVKAFGSQANAQAASLGSKASEQVKSLGTQTSGQAQSLLDRFTPKKSTLPEEFRAWAIGATESEAELTKWLIDLGDQPFADFTSHVATFATSVGFELEWLVRGEFGKMPHLAGTAQQVVINYLRACQQAAAAQSELDPFRTYREYTQNPDSRKNRVYGEHLLDHLLQAGLTTVSLSDFLGATSKAKQEQVLQAIQSAAEKDPAAFGQILKSMYAEEPSPAPQPESASAQTGA
jgi:hypothetical protein